MESRLWPHPSKQLLLRPFKTQPNLMKTFTRKATKLLTTIILFYLYDLVEVKEEEKRTYFSEKATFFHLLAAVQNGRVLLVCDRLDGTSVTLRRRARLTRPVTTRRGEYVDS
jgi:hypothetical protein